MIALAPARLLPRPRALSAPRAPCAAAVNLSMRVLDVRRIQAADQINDDIDEPAPLKGPAPLIRTMMMSVHWGAP